MAKQRTPIIGKNIIESLTLGMYENPFCIYREYIQNSADAIDKAGALGFFFIWKAACNRDPDR